MGRRLLGFLFASWLAYRLYVPLPDYCDFPIKIKGLYSLFNAFDLAGNVFELFGGSYSTPFHLTDYDPGDNLKEITTTTKTLAGRQVDIHRPIGFPKKKSGSAIIFLHGGGWTIGSRAAYAVVTRKIAKETNMMVFVPEYRLAPDHPFPAGFEDCLKVTKEIIKRARDFDINPNKIVLAGDSAGGNLAVAISLKIGEEFQNETHPICMINVIYPFMQLANFQLPSYLQNNDGGLFSPYPVVRFLLYYLGFWNHTNIIPLITRNSHMNGFKDKDILDRMSDKWIPEKYKKGLVPTDDDNEIGSDQMETYFLHATKIQEFVSNRQVAPLAASDEHLRTLPYTHVVTCEYDAIRDDGIIFYERMKDLGKKVTHQHWEFGAHALLNAYGMVEYEKLDQAMGEMFNIIQKGVDQC
uniref:arylacetamide deacetylase-like n=1 Tax=Styela clava TaxID=7725 RepID=UPI0019394B42|nr:arylacetamide deacetylase-like [Styela clava]